MAGFHAVEGTDLRCWDGPSLKCFADLSDAPTMRIVFRDGWPYVHPRVVVPGVTGEHASADGVVCLWSEEDASFEWTTWGSLSSRAEAWCERTRSGFRQVDLALDAFIGFEHRDYSAIATLDSGQLLSGVAQDGKHQRIHGVVENAGCVISLHAGRGVGGALTGRLFYRAELAAPPRTRSEFEAALTARQLARFREDLARSVPGEPPMALVVLAWHRSGLADLLVLRVLSADGEQRLASMEPAPRDQRALRLRAGPDSEALSRSHVVVFGAGAIGSQIALLLGECGVGNLQLVDGDRLRPGNVVRHVAGRHAIGWHKVVATEIELSSHAPWTVVKTQAATVQGPDDIRSLIARSNAVVDATGSWSFQEQVARVAHDVAVPLVSVALYRGGAIGRVRRQAPGDRAIWERTGALGYAVIPPDAAEGEFSLETGCSAPVSNASPAAVTAVAALGAQVLSDCLTGRLNYRPEIVDVYSPLVVPPFDRVGRVPWPTSS